jgi:hypothetical protein
MRLSKTIQRDEAPSSSWDELGLVRLCLDVKLSSHEMKWVSDTVIGVKLLTHGVGKHSMGKWVSKDGRHWLHSL